MTMQAEQTHSISGNLSQTEAQEYLESLEDLARELDRAMQAIAHVPGAIISTQLGIFENTSGAAFQLRRSWLVLALMILPIPVVQYWTSRTSIFSNCCK